VEFGFVYKGFVFDKYIVNRDSTTANYAKRQSAKEALAEGDGDSFT
jgi:hypothetical protein